MSKHEYNKFFFLQIDVKGWIQYILFCNQMSKDEHLWQMVNEEVAPLRSTYGATFAFICQKIVLLFLLLLRLLTIPFLILLCLNIFIVNIFIPNLCILITFTLNKVRTFSKKQRRGRSDASSTKLSSCSKASASQSRELTKLIL